MSVLHFVNRFFFPDHSATSQLLSDLAFQLAKTGLSVHIITSRQIYDNSHANLPAQEIIDNVRVTRVWTTRFGREKLLGRTMDYITFYLSAAWSLIVTVKSCDIIVAKTDPPLISAIAAVVAKGRGAKLINWIQDLFPEVANAVGVSGIGHLEWALSSLRNWSLHAALWNIVIGDVMAKKVESEGISPGSIRIIHNWADGHLIKPIDRYQNDLRRDWHLTDKFVVGYSGNLGRAHEIGTILDAAVRLKSNKHIIFLFIGGGAQRKVLEDQSHKQDLANIIFKPYQPKEQLCLSLSVPDIHLISLRPEFEGLIVPSKFYGVAAAGRLTIFLGAPDGEIATILSKERCGIHIGIGEGEQLAKIISELALHPEIVQRMGGAGRAAFDSLFEKTIAISKWEALLKKT